MADRDDLIESLRIRVEAEARAASDNIATLTTSLAGLVEKLASLKANKVDVNFITPAAIENLRAFSTEINKFDSGRLSELREQFMALTGALQPLSEIKIHQFFSARAAENAAIFSHAVNNIDVELLRELSQIDLSNVTEAFGSAKTLSSAISSLSGQVERLANQMGRTVAPANNVTKVLVKQARAAHSHHKAFSLANTALGRFLKLVKRVIMMRMIRSVIRQFTQGFAEGIKNLYFWSQAVGTSFAPAMDDLAKHVLYLKNGFASMWSPLLERRVIPFINSVIERLVDFFNLIQENFARLVGAPTWNKALLYPVQFAENTEEATKAAKALHNILMGFDELNVINTPHDSGSGSGKDAVDYSSMFKTMETKGGIAAKSIGEALAKAFNKLFENPEKWGDWGAKIAGWLVDGFDNALDFFEGVNWENIGASISEFATEFVNKLSDWFDDTDNWTRAINVLTDAVCGLIDGVKWDELGKSIASLGGKVALAIPSQVLAGVESGSKILATAFDKLGWSGAADSMREFAENVKGAREEYEGLASDTAKELDIYLGRKPNAKGEYESHSFIEDLKEAATVTQDTIDKRLHPHQQQADAVSEWWGSVEGDAKAFSDERKSMRNKGLSLYFKEKVSDPLKKFFDENPTPIKFVSNIFQNVKDWASENIVDPIKKYMDKNPTPLQFVSNLIGGKTAEWVRTNITDPVKKFFEKNPTPIKFVTNFFNNAHEWIKTNVSDPIKKFFEENPTPIKFIANILETVRQKWQEFKQWWGNVWEEIKLKVPNIREKVREKWESFKSWWSTLAVNLKINFPDLIQKLREKWNALVAWWRNLSLPSFNITLPRIVVQQGTLNPLKWFTEGLPKLGVEWGTYANGGFPAMGQPFFMGEGGVPEMLGKVNGRSAVVGGAEISGIADAIRASGAREEYLLQMLISVVQSKDFSFTPNAASGRMINEALQHYAGVTG